METNIAAVEQFQHVVKCLELFWGDPEFLKYHKKLTISDRPNRQGFPIDVLEELEYLHRLYLDNYELINRYPMTAAQEQEIEEVLKSKDPWGRNLGY